ncbi:MAG: SGNH/GDSL hydrolase family protein [Chitinophagaceae bacterium]|nr:SGNH/GDSL hydrolase family protein [Chitinophagaceae bacterium]
MSDTMIAIGGCHVAGYKVGEENSFVNVIAKATGFILSHRAPQYQIKKTTGIREKINSCHPDVVLLQLGNHEFSASLEQILKKKDTDTTTQNEYTLPDKKEFSKKPLLLPVVSERKAVFFLRNIMTPFIWGYLAYKNFKHLKNIRHIIKENPGTRFVILSPIPCLNTADNYIRRKAARWFKWTFAGLPNVKFIDLFRYIAVDKRYFEDPAHLNATGHRILGRIISQYIKPYKKDSHKPLAIAV